MYFILSFILAIISPGLITYGISLAIFETNNEIIVICSSLSIVTTGLLFVLYRRHIVGKPILPSPILSSTLAVVTVTTFFMSIIGELQIGFNTDQVHTILISGLNYLIVRVFAWIVSSNSKTDSIRIKAVDLPEILTFVD